MTEYTQNDKTLSLAGIYQAAQMVYELATTGKTDDNAIKASVNSLFVENPDSTLEVYGDSVNGIQLGVHCLIGQMQSKQTKQTRNIEVTRYVLSLMILSKKIQQGDGLQKITNVLETAKAQQEHFGSSHENVFATIARAYSENVSTLHPRIMVNGHHNYLNNQRIANKIRALLLAGLRSAILWYQVGGSRWGLIWSRKKYLQSAQALYRPQYEYFNQRLQEEQSQQAEQADAGGWYQGGEGGNDSQIDGRNENHEANHQPSMDKSADTNNQGNQNSPADTPSTSGSIFKDAEKTEKPQGDPAHTEGAPTNSPEGDQAKGSSSDRPSKEAQPPKDPSA